MPILVPPGVCLGARAYVCVRACVRAFMRVCAGAGACACVRARACMHEYIYLPTYMYVVVGFVVVASVCGRVSARPQARAVWFPYQDTG